MPDNKIPRLYTAQEVADALRIHKETALRLLRDGKIPGFKIGYDWRVSEEQLNEYIQKKIVS